MASGKKESKLYRFLIKTDNKEKFYAHIILLLFGIFWIIYYIINFDDIFDNIIFEYTWYNIDPLPRIIVITFVPLIYIILGYLGLNDYYRRKNKN